MMCRMEVLRRPGSGFMVADRNVSDVSYYDQSSD